MNDAHTVGFRRRHLPHWTVADRTYFVTIRLKGSLPAAVVDELRCERETLLARNPSSDEIDRARQREFLRIEANLDAAKSGARFLDSGSLADLVCKAFEWLESQKGWIVHALCVMPNHVHGVMRNTQSRNDELNRDMGILKGFTAREANRLLKRTGQPFWADENFDHWCRNDEKLRDAVRYTALNPVKAGLAASWRNWPWTRVGQAFLHDMERQSMQESAKNG